MAELGCYSFTGCERVNQMKKLLKFLVGKITGSDDFEIESVEENGRESLFVKANPEIIGMIIGKEGRTIKNIRRIAAIKATLENKLINISVEEKA